MNGLIESSIENLKIHSGSDVPKILPHQLATVDFIFKNIIIKKESLLLFHKMGSGKTIISLISAFLLAKNDKKIIIILPNENIKSLWINNISVIKQLLPSENYKTHNIEFITKKGFSDNIEIDIDKDKVLINSFQNTVFIIDEAHNFFGNKGASNIISLNNFFNNKNLIKPLYILVTGSPITNTMLTFKDLYSILTYKTISETDYMLQDGNKIFNISLTDKGKEIILRDLKGKISSFNQKSNEIPKTIYMGKALINIPVIPCVMSDAQTRTYIEYKKELKQEMFLKYLLDASFTDMGHISNIYEFENKIKNLDNVKLTNRLSISNGKFVGPELTDLENSCKLKYFVENKIKDLSTICKTFVYFSNSKIGGRFLKDMLQALGVQEYGDKSLENYICYFCYRDRTCQKCKPITYIIITSIYLTNINHSLINKIKNTGSDDKENTSSNNINTLLDIYNLPNNNNGEEITFLFGSKIISESYTLKETREIWFLTIPDSLSEMSQITSRCLRNFSYADLNLPIKIYVLLAVTKGFDIENILKTEHKDSIFLTNPKNKSENADDVNLYIDQLMHEKNYPYDLKKMLYLEIKSKQTNEIHNTFKSLSKKYASPMEKDVEELYVLEILRKLIYKNNRLTIKKIQSHIPSALMDLNHIENIVEKFVDDKIIINNEHFKQCFLIKHKDEYVAQPITIDYRPFIYKIDM